MNNNDKPPLRRVTSIDVAERAGVSQSTVSRALSGSETITEATRRRVELAAEQLGYHVNARAAGLRRGETGTIAIVVIGREGQGPAAINPFYYSLLGSTCAAAAERGYEALVSFQARPDEFFGHYVARRQADGVVVIGTATNEAAWDYFRTCAEQSKGMAFWDHLSTTASGYVPTIGKPGAWRSSGWREAGRSGSFSSAIRRHRSVSSGNGTKGIATPWSRLACRRSSR